MGSCPINGAGARSGEQTIKIKMRIRIMNGIKSRIRSKIRMAL